MATVQNKAEYGPVDVGMDNNNFLITPSDTVNLPVAIDAIIVGDTGGDISMLMPAGNTVTISVAANTTQFVNQPIRILDTGTDATTLVGVASKALR